MLDHSTLGSGDSEVQNKVAIVTQSQLSSDSLDTISTTIPEKDTTNGGKTSTIECIDRVTDSKTSSPPLGMPSIRGRGQPEPKISPWRPSALRIAPIFGLVALAFTVLQVIASYAVLASSNGAAVSTWRYQPTVYLAVFTALSNKTLAFAAIQGAVVTFWLRILQGTTMAQVHRDWSYSQWVYTAICSGRNCSLVALACICATLVAIDGPLLQRATTVRSTVPGSDISLSVSLSPELPSYFTGRVHNYHATNIEFENDFLPVIKDFISKGPMQAAVTGCEGKCSATVRGPALTIDHCHSTSTFVNFSKPLSPEEVKQVVAGGAGGLPHHRFIFDVSLRLEKGTPEMLLLGTTIASKQTHETCAGPVSETICYIVSAIAEYPIIINDGIISFADSQTSRSPKIVAVANNTAVTNKTINEYALLQPDSSTLSTLAGIANAGNYEYFTSLAAFPFPDPDSKIAIAGAATWFTFEHENNFVGSNKSCAPLFSDPTEEIMGSLNELVFRTGVYTALHYGDDFFKAHLDEGLQVQQNVTGRPLSSINTFHTNFHYFAAAAAVQLFTVIVILTTFWGWWRLGRNASFSPLETAKAFDAPILHDVSSNESGRQIAKVAGARRIQYGILRKGPGLERLVVANEGAVDEPVGRPFTVREHYAIVRANMPRRRRWGEISSAEGESESRGQSGFAPEGNHWKI